MNVVDNRTTPSGEVWPRYGILMVPLAAFLMTATLPGRTHGLGLASDGMMSSIGLDRTTFALLNLVATLVGAGFALPVGRWADVFGLRGVSTVTVACLGVACWILGMAQTWLTLLLGLVLVRGFGQSALSVVALITIGKWYRRRLGLAMAIFSVLLTIGFIAATLWLEDAIRTTGWARAFHLLGLFLVISAPVVGLLSKRPPTRLPEPAGPTVPPTEPERHLTLVQAITQPAFWAYALAAALFNAVWSGITLFPEDFLREHQVDPTIVGMFQASLAGTGLIANLIAGAFCRPGRIGPLLGVGMASLAAALLVGTLANTTSLALLYASLVGFSGGFVTVTFFAVWGDQFGRRELGSIQGSVQVLATVASALGPVGMATAREAFGSYSPALAVAAVLAMLLAVAVLRCPVPKGNNMPVSSG